MPPRIRVRVQFDNAEMVRVPTEAALKLVTRAARLTTNRAKFYAPVDTGRLRSSIGTFGLRVTRDSVRQNVGTTRVRYAMAQHEGAKARVIVPRRARALRFYWDVTGRVEHFKKVNWPGIGATPFLTTGLREAAEPLGFRVTTIRTADTE
jgi:hypothetical protein